MTLEDWLAARQLPFFSSACWATPSSRASGSKLKSWSCGINSMFCNSARHAGCICTAPAVPCSFGSIIAVLAFLTPYPIVRPETVVRWHRMGFAAYWRWKSRSPGGRPRITHASAGHRPPAARAEAAKCVPTKGELYPVHAITRKSLGDMTRKLSVTESRRLAQFRGTSSRRKPSIASANWVNVA